MVRIAFLGDIMLGRSVSDAILTNGPYYPWGDTIQILREADLRIANLECPISHQGTKFRPKKFHFRASPRSIDALKAAGINCVALANNHVLDFGEVAMADTIRLLDEAGIAHAGAGCNKTQAMKPAFLKAGNLDIGVVSITDEMPNEGCRKKRRNQLHPVTYLAWIVSICEAKILLFYSHGIRRLRP
jgi:poly-gamma-glutamate capsule biosynthesis protein CapA/YwtB (metallophosphatase superfamily)